MLHERIDQLLANGGIIHIRGGPGTGKTVLASRIAAEVSRRGRVEWLCNDGKISFTEVLTRNIQRHGGLSSNITILQPRGHLEARIIIESLRESVSHDTRLVVIDPLTRVLDMGRRSEEMWGRVLIEETLPTIAGLALETSVCFLVTSEVRMIDEADIPIHHEKIRQWTDLEVKLDRPRMRGMTHIHLQDNGQGPVHIGGMRITREGTVEILAPTKGGDETDCSESPCTA
ncbi:MAG: hypothetical protein KAR33_01300 [Candidatus Thorarchaeota archaeon]|nr:hypothetical protein [Candidatus Thorarchaeota archaeon]